MEWPSQPTDENRSLAAKPLVLTDVMSTTETSIASWTKHNAAQRAGLEKLGLHTIANLWTHYPRRHEDRCHVDGFPDNATALPVAIDACIFAVNVRRFGR